MYGPLRGKSLHFEGSKVFLEFERNRASQPQAQFKTSDFNFDSHVLDAVNLALKKRHFRNKPLLVYTNEKATRDLMAIGELERIKSIKSKPGASVQDGLLLSQKNWFQSPFPAMVHTRSLSQRSSMLGLFGPTFRTPTSTLT
eukprot:Em0819g3a